MGCIYKNHIVKNQYRKVYYLKEKSNSTFIEGYNKSIIIFVKIRFYLKKNYLFDLFL